MAALALRGAVVAACLTLHPLHTTLTEIALAPDGHHGTLTVRAFRDDFATAVARSSGVRFAGADPIIPDSLAARYVRQKIQLVDGAGRPVALEWVGSRRTGDITWLTLQFLTPDGLRGGRLTQSFHTELFEDQVNVVKFRTPSGEESFLFTPGDGAKPLP